MVSISILPLWVQFGMRLILTKETFDCYCVANATSMARKKKIIKDCLYRIYVQWTLQSYSSFKRWSKCLFPDKCLSMLFVPGKHRQLSSEGVYRCPHPSSTYNSCMIWIAVSTMQTSTSSIICGYFLPVASTLHEIL